MQHSARTGMELTFQSRHHIRATLQKVSPLVPLSFSRFRDHASMLDGKPFGTSLCCFCISCYASTGRVNKWDEWRHLSGTRGVISCCQHEDHLPHKPWCFLAHTGCEEASFFSHCLLLRGSLSLHLLLRITGKHVWLMRFRSRLSVTVGCSVRLYHGSPLPFHVHPWKDQSRVSTRHVGEQVYCVLILCFVK